MIYVDKKEYEIRILNSIPWPKEYYKDNLVKELEKINKDFFQKESLKYIVDECPKQSNTYDCGIYLLIFIEKILNK